MFERSRLIKIIFKPKSENKKLDKYMEENHSLEANSSLSDQEFHDLYVLNGLLNII
jgi:predicted ATPase